MPPVGRSRWTSADAPAGLARVPRQPDRGSGADEGFRPTTVKILVKDDVSRAIPEDEALDWA